MESPHPIYEIRIAGHLSPQWMDWFHGLTVTLEKDGNTLLSGPVADQAALHGLLKKVRDAGMPLISVNPIRVDEIPPDHPKQGEPKMNSLKTIDTKVLLSTLWIAVMINMLKADILSLYIPGSAEEVAGTAASAGATIPLLMLVAALIGELAIAMIVLSRVLTHRLNRQVNLVVGLLTLAYIWGGAASYPHYTFIAAAESLCLLLILWTAWKWTSPEG